MYTECWYIHYTSIVYTVPAYGGCRMYTQCQALLLPLVFILPRPAPQSPHPLSVQCNAMDSGKLKSYEFDKNGSDRDLFGKQELAS